MARVMLNSKNLAKNVWAQAVSTACNTINRIYLRRDTKPTPYELWKGKKPNLRYLVFGRKCYILRNREQLEKFDSRSDEGVFLGYSTNSKAYRVYNLRNQSVMEFVKVVIDEYGNEISSLSTDNEDNKGVGHDYIQEMDDSPSTQVLEEHHD